MRLNSVNVGVLAGLLAVAPAASAQQHSAIDAGGWIIGGSAGLSRSHDNTSDLTSTNAQISPLALRFVANRLAVGGTVLLSYSSNSFGHASSVGVGPAVRYYFGDPAGKLFPFLSGSVAPQWVNSRTKTFIAGTPVDVDGSSHYTSADGSVGLTDLVSANVGLTGELYYAHLSTHTNQPAAVDRNSYSYGMRFGITVFAR